MADDSRNNSAEIVRDETFYMFGDDTRTSVFEIFPKVFNDNRGWFSEVLNDHDRGELWWLKQINRSSSKPGVIRGCHAQSGWWCQAKLVEALTEVVFDFIVDARPDSETFGVSKIYRLDPSKQNKLWIPRGFLHAIIVPSSAKSNALFNYCCDNVYRKEAEICINPQSIITRNLGILRSWCKEHVEMDEMFHEVAACSDESWIYSEKDLAGLDYDTWMTSLKVAHDDGDLEKSLWYKCSEPPEDAFVPAEGVTLSC